MLLSLKVKNFILIRDLQFAPDRHLNVVTGETGAGKSILLGALGLVLGNRTETNSLLNKEEKCVVEAEFDIQSRGLQEFFKLNELDYDHVCILRREISPSGKSRAFINDTPVNISQLKELGDRLIEIHTQHTGLLIANEAEQLRILDDFCGNQPLLEKYHAAWKERTRISKSLQQAQDELRQHKAQREFLQFQKEELTKFQLVDGEENLLLEEINSLTHSSEILEACTESGFLLTDGEQAATTVLNQTRSRLRQIQSYHPGLADLISRLDSTIEELKDISQSIARIADLSESNPDRLEYTNERLANLQMLFRKHQVDSSRELIHALDAIAKSVNKVEEVANTVEILENALMQSNTLCRDLAVELHIIRSNQSGHLCSSAIGLLEQLEIPNASLSINISFDEEALTPTGGDIMSFLFSANAGVPSSKLSKVASGGELSRLHFVLKTLLAGKKDMPVLIFDEADTGVSGEVASKIGSMMRKLGQKHQVIAITHLAQVAACADTQYYVYKSELDEISSTEIQKLSQADRVFIIAQMLSGKEPGKAALANARELLAR